MNIGTKIAHYTITSKLAAGGMGEVYRARDEMLERDVALKLLPPESFRDSAARSRLLQEARAAAALNHPHICTIHEVGEADGQAYIAMELVEGRTLSELLQSGPLPPADVVRYGAQIADALSHAHERRVVHRDLKTANVIICQGRAKVLDFGLARRLRENELEEVTRSQASLTKPGAVVGTLAYMSPEQLRGEPADARSDIWALGVVLYEMTAGTRPFRAQTGFALSSAILNETPPPLPATTPAPLRALVERCLQKDPARRYQRAGEVGAALEAIHAAAPAPWLAWQTAIVRRAWLAAALLVALVLITLGFDVGGIRSRLAGSSGGQKFDSLAVLPLENLSGDPEQDYLAAGMHEALIVDLGKLSGLRRVSARPSALRYHKSNKPLRQIADELGVAAIITGTVTRSGNRVRVTAHLLNPSDEQQLWSESYEREVRDVLALQNEIVSAIAAQVQLKLTPREQVGLARARQVNPQAYEAYLKGMFKIRKFVPEEFQKGMALLQQAVSIDPAEPLAYAGLAQAYDLANVFELAPSAKYLPDYRAAAMKAVQLDPTLAEAHLAVAGYKLREWDFDGAGESLRRAVALNPNLPEAHIQHGWFLSAFGSPEQAVAEMKRGVELDPLSPLYNAWLGGLYWELGRPDEAIIEANKALELQADFPVALYVLGLSYSDKARHDDAIAVHRSALAKYPKHNFSWALARTYAVAGRTTEARRILAALESGKSTDALHPWFIAGAYLAAGQREKALDWLEKAYEQRNPFLTNLKRDRSAGLDIKLLRDHPRFQALLRRLNLAP